MPPDLEACKYNLTFLEDFSDFQVAPWTIGPARWTAHTPWHGDFGSATFIDPGKNDPFSVSDGVLNITARKQADGRWTSGLIAAADGTGRGFGARYGYFEARMKFPRGPGTWPAFWLTSLKPASDTSPSVEIDVIEYYGHATASYQSALHVWYVGDDKEKSTHTLHRVHVPKNSLVDAYHNYGVDIRPDTITYYFDRKPVWQQPTPAELVWPSYPLVNLALGSGFPIAKTPNPSTLKVKFVRVLTYDPNKKC